MAPLVFPTALFVFAFFCLLGDLGRYYDDYALAGRDPVSNAIDWTGNPWRHTPYFWRPLLFPFLHYTLGLLWDHMWVMHALNIICHGFVVLALFTLLRRLGVSIEAAAVGTLLFAFYPLHFDVVFWSTAITTSLPAGLAVLLCLVYLRHVAVPRRATMATLIVLAFIIPCFYEQPVTLVPALPLLYFAACPREQPWRARLLHASLPVVYMGLGLCVYIGLMFATVPAARRGGAMSLVTPGEIFGRVGAVWGQVLSFAGPQLRLFCEGAFALSWQTLGSWVGPLAAGAGLVGGVVWVRWFASGSEPAPGEQFQSRPQRGWIIIFAVSWFLLAWLPLVVIRDQLVYCRSFYTPLLPAAICLAVALDGLFAVLQRKPWTAGLRVVVGGACVLAVTFSAFCFVGWQVLHRARFAANERQLAALAARVPMLPSGAVIVVLEDRFKPAATQHYLFNNALISWTGSWLTAQSALRHALNKDDIFSTHLNVWNPLPIVDPVPEGFTYHTPIPPYLDVAGHSRIPWAVTVPLCIDAAGDVSLVDRIILKAADGSSREIRPPLVTSAVPGPVRSFTFPSVPIQSAYSRGE